MGKKTRSQLREEIDWLGLFKEGFHLSLVGREASAFIAPCDDQNHILVVLLKAPKEKIVGVKQTLLTMADTVDTIQNIGKLIRGMG